MKSVFDIIIVGAGPIGLACALEAKRKGLQYLIIEKGALVNSLYNYPVNMTFFSTSEKLEIGGVPFVSNTIKPTRNESLEYYRRVTIASGLSLHLFEEVKTISQEEELFTVHTSKDKYTTSNIIIATGFYDLPFLLNIPGEALPKVTHYYKDPHFYAFQKVLVIGASNSAVDAALETYRKGAEVTMVIREKDIGERVKYWVRPDIINRVKEGTINAFFNSTVAAIRENEVDINTNDGLVTIANDWVIAMTGYQPNLTFLEKIGIKLSADEVRKPLYDTDTHETNIKGIYLAGVICGGMDTHSLFIENSREHAVKIIDNILHHKMAVL
ncbi:YpdA family putative bacillithiol disulfide reductase [Ferruginibacter sp.]|uniref:YpdA family putative bacillithiol disulfide reductase n=1 Tax=Ferruginibacter sp. TaxID=1940288 RepID=UPI00198EC238|nr:YpdA family putative bacillithiol disulfide reductase [Ferruginibacter sp.]MBC7627184.1 YpdA family putative bacillithiol disulfide reductase [Ferruginibacter sp.]